MTALMTDQEIKESLSERNPFRNAMEDCESPVDAEDTPRNSGVMIHIVPETSKARWNHIKDLDSFFKRMYNYHQKHGFFVIVVDEVFQLLEFGFVVWLLTFTIHCVKHSVLFGDTPPESNHTKVTLNDVIIPMGECVDNFGGVTFLILFISVLYFLIRCIKMIYHITQYADIKKFFNSALLIEDNDLDNITWHEVKKRVREVQAEQHMCIDKEQLTELDIYHRILRFENYMVALMNKNLIPVRFNVPLFGQMVFLSRGLMYNIDLILFRGPGSPFQNNWQLSDDYALRSNQVELAQRLSNLIFWVAVVNLILAPAIFFWQIIYFAFAYINILRREPGTLGIRTWSNYGRLYLRHFNELEHELDARISRAYQPAEKYISSFSSPVISIFAKNVLFMTGGVLLLLLALGIYEEFVFQVEHVLTIITALSAVGLVCRTLIPDENIIWCPEQLMTVILAHTHYLPSEWKNQAHTSLVRNEFSNFFQYKAIYILNEVCSPLTTPFILMFAFRPKTIEIVKFFRSFTVTVKGVGNVCSFAQMDVRKHGNREWRLETSAELRPRNYNEDSAENGKTELSLLHFTLTNPEWRMPNEALKFVKSVRQSAVQDLTNAQILTETNSKNAMEESLLSFGTIGEEYSSIAHSVLNIHNVAYNKPPTSVPQPFAPGLSSDLRKLPLTNQESAFDQMLTQDLEDPFHASGRNMLLTNTHFVSQKEKRFRKMRVFKLEGPLEGPTEGLLYSISNLESSLVARQIDVTVADMCLSTLYLHELHQKNKKTKKNWTSGTTYAGQQHSSVISTPAESTPLLGPSHS